LPSRPGSLTAATGASSPPIVIPGRPTPSAVPQVEHWDEEIYRCKPGDTFASISTRYFGSDKYAPALAAFNRSHPQANDGVKANQPLQADWKVYLPPLSVLERRHGSAIPNVARPPVGPDSTPGGSGIMPVAARTAPGAAGSGPGYKTYVVRDKEESMWKIAARTLGKGDHWPQIMELNPGVPTTGFLPVGTELRLPANAVVP
jgi:phage tail protein X